MSRILITNKTEYYNTLHNINVSNGFCVSGYQKDVLYFENYKKLNVDNYNFYSENEGFVAIVGTAIYNNALGEDALKQVYSDYKKNGISYVRQRVVGTYAMCIKDANEINIFIDESGNYALYYYNVDAEFCISNLVYHLGLVAKEIVNRNVLLEALNEYCILDNQTFYNNVYRLMADEIISIDIKKNSFDVKYFECTHYKLESISFDETVSILTQTITKYAKMQSDIPYEKVFFMTGGMDSRLSLAGDIASGISPKLANWQGSPILMNTKVEDQEVTMRIADELNLEFEAINVSEEGLHEISKNEFERIGEYACEYGNNTEWHEYFKNTKDCFFDFGYFGETLKEWTLLEENYHTKFTIGEFAKMYVTRKRSDYVGFSSKDKRVYYTYILDKFRCICNVAGFDEDNLSEEDCMYLYYCYRTHADTKMVNFANMYGYCFNLYAQKELIDYINQCLYEHKRNGKLNLALTCKLCEKLTTIPYFSHCHYIDFNMQKMVLADPGIDSLLSLNDRIWLQVPVALKKVILKHIPNIRKEIIDKFHMKRIKEEWIRKVDENTYDSIGEYKLYYDYYTMLRSV